MSLRKLLPIVLSTAALISFGVVADDNPVTEVGKGVSDAAVDVGNAVEGAVKTTGKTIDNVVTGDKSNTVVQPSDKSIATNVRTKIQDLKANNKINAGTTLEVSVNKGVVKISGTIRNPDDIDTVKAAARSEAGVKDVVMNVQVRR
jgi:osmotically-inducible protein OsmY